MSVEYFEIFYKHLIIFFHISYLEYTAYDILKDNILSQKSIRRIKKHLQVYTKQHKDIEKHISKKILLVIIDVSVLMLIKGLK